MNPPRIPLAGKAELLRLLRMDMREVSSQVRRETEPAPADPDARDNRG